LRRKLKEMKNSTEFGTSGQIPQQQQAQQQHTIEFQPLPPPYTVENTGTAYNPTNWPAGHAVYPNWIPNTATASIASNLNLLNQTLGNEERFTLSPTGRFGFTTRTVVVQMRDSAQRPLVSIMILAGRNISTGGYNNDSIRIGSVIQMNNSYGQTLLTGAENGQSITVSSGDQILGTVEGHLLCSTSLTATGIMGETLFQSIGGTEMNVSSSGGCCGSIPSEFTLLSNGVALARIERSPNNSNDGLVTLFNSQNFDLRTKALLLFVGYLIYYAFLADTTFGKVGARGFAKRLCMYVCIFFVVMMVLFISIPIIIIATRF